MNKMSKPGTVALTSLSKRFHFTPPSALSLRPRDSSAPKLILLFTWMGGSLSHAQKYLSGYHAIWPATPIILVQSLPTDFRPFSRFAKEFDTLLSLLAQHDVDLTKEADGNQVLMATMSNGGCWAVDALISALPPDSVLRPRAFVLDSCPGKTRYSVTLKAFLIAGQYGLLRKAIAVVVVTIYYFMSKVLNLVVGREPLTTLRKTMIQNVVAKRRAYIYSKDDELILWRDIEDHRRSALEAGQQDASLNCFDNSAHVAHLRSDAQRYWDVVRHTWDPTAAPSKEMQAAAGKDAAPEVGIEPKTETEAESPAVALSPAEAPIASVYAAEVTADAQDLPEQAVESVSSSDSESAEDLSPSILGTKEYWEDIYRRERSNYAENSEDEGEIWFGEEAEDKLIDYLENNCSKNSPLKVVDLGTGNGHLLFKLYEEGFRRWKLRGIDYSAQSIELARAIATARGISSISFAVQDFLEQDKGAARETFDIVLDKGTYDAISLSEQTTGTGQRLNEIYAKSVARLMKPTAKLVITSCNWTQEELIRRLTVDKVLKVHAFFKKPKQQFSFGGKTGSTTSSVCFALA